MKKVKVLLSAVAVVAVVAGAVASNARVNAKIYTPNPANPQLCDVLLTPRSFVASPLGHDFASTKIGPCVQGIISVVQD